MIVPNVVQPHPASIDSYIRQGWHLVPIPPNTKGPRTVGWNARHAAVASQADLPAGYGIGLAHAYSGTMALDIDNWDMAAEMLKAAGVDLNNLYNAPDAVIINSGRPGHGKLLYAMPGVTLPTKKVMKDNITVYELRCATVNGLTVQDVLPPSIHPDTGQPYRWDGNGHWTRLPLLPQALLTAWTDLLDMDKKRVIPTGDAISTSWDEIHQALKRIPADCSREQWINIGMALQWAGAQTNNIDHAFHLWDEWSMTSIAKYPGHREMRKQWDSFRQDKGTIVKLGTLYHIAKEYGWQRPIPDVAELFKAVEKKIVNPLDVISGLRPKAPNMDLSLWPQVLRQRTSEVATSIGCTPMIPLFAGVAAVCGVVDARIRLELMPGFLVPPVLWLMTIGEPGDKKTPGSKPMLSPLRQIEKEDYPRFKKELLDWEGKEAAYAASKKNFLSWAASPDALVDADQAPEVPDMPPQPQPLKITVGDITSQMLVRKVAARPRGVLCYLDEMGEWVKKMTNVSSGEDRSSWVVAYEASTYEMDRVGAGSIHCDNFAVSVYGNLQPTLFRNNVKALSSDGLLQRFIPVVTYTTRTKLGQPIPDHMSSAKVWENTLRLIYALPEQTYRLSTEAYDEFRTYQQWYEDARQDERTLNSGVEYMTAFGKLEGLAGRLILIFHLIESPFSPQVSVDIVKRVIDLIKGYMIPAYRYALGEVGGLNAADGLEKWLIDHIVMLSADTSVISLTQLKRSARRPLEGRTDFQKDQDIIEAMSTLERSGWVHPIEFEMHKKRVSWAINPAISTEYKDYRNKVLKAKQRHADYIYRHALAKGKDRKIIKGYDPETMDE